MTKRGEAYQVQKFPEGTKVKEENGTTIMTVIGYPIKWPSPLKRYKDFTQAICTWEDNGEEKRQTFNVDSLIVV